MDEQTRRDVDEACLRLMGHEDLRWQDGSGGWWWGPTFGDQIHAPMSPSRQPAFVVPLAEALRERGHSLDIWGGFSGWRVLIGPENLIEAEAGTLPEALAVAAARAVGTETEE